MSEHEYTVGYTLLSKENICGNDISGAQPLQHSPVGPRLASFFSYFTSRCGRIDGVPQASHADQYNQCSLEK